MKCSVGESRNTQVLGLVKTWSTSLGFEDLDFPSLLHSSPGFTRPSISLFPVRLVSAR